MDEDVQPIFSWAYWETDVKEFILLIFQPAGIVTILLTGIEDNNEKINNYISVMLASMLL